MSTVTEKAYNLLSAYVKRNGYTRTFTTNTLRNKLSTVRGLKPAQMGGIIATAVRRGLIYKVGEVTSNAPNHNSGRVGVYAR